MEIATEKKMNKQIVRLKGKLDTITVSEFEKVCKELIAQDNMPLVIDCSELEYISSAGLRGILLIGKMLTSQKSSLQLASLSDFVKEVFSMSGFDKFFVVHATLEQALEAD